MTTISILASAAAIFFTSMQIHLVQLPSRLYSSMWLSSVTTSVLLQRRKHRSGLYHSQSVSSKRALSSSSGWEPTKKRSTSSGAWAASKKSSTRKVAFGVPNSSVRSRMILCSRKSKRARGLSALGPVSRKGVSIAVKRCPHPVGRPSYSSSPNVQSLRELTSNSTSRSTSRRQIVRHRMETCF